MKELITITDPVRISFIEALLNEADIDYVIRDANVAYLFGQDNGLFPRRLAVGYRDVMPAVRILTAAGQYYNE